MYAAIVEVVSSYCVRPIRPNPLNAQVAVRPKPISCFRLLPARLPGRPDLVHPGADAAAAPVFREPDSSSV